MKIKELQKELQKKKIDYAVFYDKDPNLQYFAEVTAEHIILTVPKKGKPTLHVAGFEADRIKKQTKIKVIKGRKIKVKGTIGVVYNKISLKKAKELEKQGKITNIEETCIKLRQVKTKKEQEIIRKACKETDKIMQHCLNNLNRFKTEQDIAKYLKKIINFLGYEPSFKPIIATGKNAGTPHHTPGKTKLKGFTIIDFGIKYKGYCSDMTRTVYYGKPSKKEENTYKKLLQIQKELITKAKEGTTFEKINELAHKKIGKKLIHKIGHSLGIEVHDPSERPLKLKKGMIITIEPGMYTKKYGIRIEDDILITKNKPEILTQTTKELKKANF